MNAALIRRLETHARTGHPTDPWSALWPLEPGENDSFAGVAKRLATEGFSIEWPEVAGYWFGWQHIPSLDIHEGNVRGWAWWHGLEGVDVVTFTDAAYLGQAHRRGEFAEQTTLGVLDGGKSLRTIAHGGEFQR